MFAYSQDVTITTEKSGDNFKTTISYDRQTINVEGQLSVNSGRSAGYFRFNHPNSFTDIQLNGDVSSDYEKTAANFVFKYMMSRDRQLQTSSLRTLFNGQRKEINIEVIRHHTSFTVIPPLFLPSFSLEFLRQSSITPCP